MKKIKLTQGKYALVDDKDFEYLNSFKWRAAKDRYTYYAVRSSKRKTMSMHRAIMEITSKLQTDHINGNGLDNRRKNLRVCTHQENVINSRKQKNNTSGYKGVGWEKRRKKWIARITKSGKNKYLGQFDTAKQAYAAYCEAAKELHKDFARLF
jgi:hypothetical protein